MGTWVGWYRGGARRLHDRRLAGTAGWPRRRPAGAADDIQLAAVLGGLAAYGVTGTSPGWLLADTEVAPRHDEDSDGDLGGTVCRRRRAAHRGDSGSVGIHECHCDAPASKSEGRTVREPIGPAAKVGRRCGAGAADRTRGSHRTEPAGTVGGGWCRWRHRVGGRLWLGGSREPDARRA